MDLSCYIDRIDGWQEEVFKGTIHEPTPKIRAMRALEEIVELFQAAGPELGLLEEEMIRVIRYVLSRPVGEVHQEYGQALLCILSYGTALKIDQEWELLSEIERIDTPVMKLKIYNKQAFKKANGLA